MLESFTTEEKDVSYAIIDKLLIYSKKNRGPKMDLSGTPALISARASPEIPTCPSL